MINVLGSVGRIGAAADLVETQGGFQRLTSAASAQLQQLLAGRYAVGPLSSSYMASGGTSPANDPNADSWAWEASLAGGSGQTVIDQLKSLTGGATAVVNIADLQKAMEGDTANIRYYIVKNKDVANWYASTGSPVAIIPPVAGAAGAGATDEKKGMSTAAKVAVGAAILGAGWLAVKQLGKPSAPTAAY